jgi:hypothetical protein
VSFLGDVIGELLGGALDGIAWWHKPAPHFPEGSEKASLGCVAGFLAFMSVLIGLPGFIFAVVFAGVRAPESLFILGFVAGSALLAIGAIRVGGKALVMTQRNAILSHLARATGYIVLVVSAASSILSVFEVARWLA